MIGQPEPDDKLIAEALGWQRAMEREDADWNAYTAWLESNPHHRAVIDEIALIERAYASHADQLQQRIAVVAEPVQQGMRWRWIGGSVAAAIAVAVAAPMFWQTAPDTVYTTATGEHRLVTLAGGTAIDLGPSTQLIAKAGNPNDLRLERGEAYFAVPHDPNRTLAIKAGDYTVSDIGTTFEINRTGDILTVAVADGHVSIANPRATAVQLSAGQQLIADPEKPVQTIGPVARGDIGSWRHGRLIYADTPLPVVAADIARYSGKRVEVDSTLRQRVFSGVLVVEEGPQMLANLADLMAIACVETGDHYSLRAAGGR